RSLQIARSACAVAAQTASMSISAQDARGTLKLKRCFAAATSWPSRSKATALTTEVPASIPISKGPSLFACGVSEAMPQPSSVGILEGRPAGAGLPLLGLASLLAVELLQDLLR